MLTNEEEKFLQFWQNNREKEKGVLKPIFIGASFGLLIGIAILVTLVSGWYKRAVMIANTEFNPLTFIIGTIIIAFFIGVFYKKHRWEMNEQHYKELVHKKSGLKNDAANSAIL